jgi:hypothetical protein
MKVKITALILASLLIVTMWSLVARLDRLSHVGVYQLDSNGLLVDTRDGKTYQITKGDDGKRYWVLSAEVERH